MECGCYQGDHYGDRDVGDFNLEEDQSPQHHPLHRSWDHKTMDSVIESEEGLKADSPNIAEAETSNSKPHEEEKEVKTESILKEEKKKMKEEDEDEKTKTAFHKIAKVSLKFVYLELGTLVAALLRKNKSRNPVHHSVKEKYIQLCVKTCVQHWIGHLKMAGHCLLWLVCLVRYLYLISCDCILI
ncbi:hypothetical protein Bca52824_067763 [Brassica carinata]|uniref:Uncharacterized protein n=1 Tax=Brassica carinata TaxID=52824 RepID=A0A8X7QNZ8_BRACI|nr:hypothetical protein Bca52824_067763 [Brassica carinata]